MKLWNPHHKTPDRIPVTAIITIWDENIQEYILYPDIYEWRGTGWRNEATGRILEKGDQPYWWALETDLIDLLKRHQEQAV